MCPNIIPYKEFNPTIGSNFFLAPTAWVIGKVTIASDVSIFFGAVLRGDIQHIYVGKGSNIQENAVLHTSRGLHDCIVGENVTVGHGAILHGCEIKGNAIIGMGSTILDDAVIGNNCIIGANSLITMRTIIPDGSMVMGSPAKVVRQLKPAEIEEIQASAESYRKVGAQYREYFAGLEQPKPGSKG